VHLVSDGLRVLFGPEHQRRADIDGDFHRSPFHR